MLPNDDLKRWGEPPTDPSELAMSHLLADLLERDRQGTLNEASLRDFRRADPAGLLDVASWIEQLVGLVVERSGVLENVPPPADPGGPSRPRQVDLRVMVHRLVRGGLHTVASTHAQPTTLRDLRRVPDNPDRVILQTGDRVRIEVISDTPGYVTVFNIGPRGGVNLLYPVSTDRLETLRKGVPLSIMDVELTPPAGAERLYAVWTREPVTVKQLVEQVRPGVTLRDMQRVQETLTKVADQDWHAVMLELEHR